MQYDHHQNTTEQALASEVSVASLLIRVTPLLRHALRCGTAGLVNSTRPRIRQQGRMRIRVDRSTYALLCTPAGRRVWVGCLPECECLLQARTVHR